MEIMEESVSDFTPGLARNSGGGFDAAQMVVLI